MQKIDVDMMQYVQIIKDEYPQEQTLKEMFKSNFQTRNKIRLCDSKIKNIRTKNKNTRCARQM